MVTERAGRTAASPGGSPRGPLPPAAMAPQRGPLFAAGRRAALGPPGHVVSDLSGIDGEIRVRYEAVYRRAEPAGGERRLLLAVLEDGIRTFLKNAGARHGRALNLRSEALAWLTNADRSDVFAFENICEALGIDPRRLRHRVLTESARAPSLDSVA